MNKVVTAADAALASAIESGDKNRIDEAARKAFGTRQWADQTINIARGCEIDCLG